MGAAVAVVLMKERQVVAAFENAGATTPERAVNPDDIGTDMHGVAWRRLRNRAIVRETAEGKYYVDVEVWQATRKTRQRLIFVVLIVILMVAIVSALKAQSVSADLVTPPRVTTDAGILAGRVDSASHALVFEGIPYAAPPVGTLRWRAPQPAAHWSGMRAADHLAHNCMQAQPWNDIDAYAAGISEDCLYLNVWTPSTHGAHPVMVWIHGGGFIAGFGGEERHRPAPLVQKGAVVVTLNYRLGAFGFLAHPALAAESPHHVSGNYGMLDQIAALQWVKRNIAKFGGDPSRVTIFGESAGGMSVGILVASPLAKGLFARAILESGVGSGSAVRSRDSAQHVGINLADTLGAAGTGASAIAKLRAVSAESLLATSVRVAGGPGTPVHWPNIDGYLLRHSVDSTLALGQGNVVPVIAGSNADEDQEFFGAPARAFARLITSRGARAYIYQFTRAGDDSASRAHGAYHSSEITFVFGRPQPLTAWAGHARYDAALADAMSSYWVAFATSGNPNGPPTAGQLPRWPVYDAATDAYIELGQQVVAKRDLRRAQFDAYDTEARAKGAVRP
jgi:para-nitrobenzyl esterase